MDRDKKSFGHFEGVKTNASKTYRKIFLPLAAQNISLGKSGEILLIKDEKRYDTCYRCMWANWF